MKEYSRRVDGFVLLGHRRFSARSEACVQLNARNQA